MERKSSDSGRINVTEQIQPEISHQHDDDNDLTLFQSMRKWHRVTLYCIGMTSAIIMYGFDYVIVGSSSAMPSFQKDYGFKHEGQWILPSLWLGLWNFASPGGSMAGAVFGGFFQDWRGRRQSLAVGSFLSAIGVAIIFVSNLFDDINARRGVFLAGKAFQGGAIGIVLTTTQTYMSEILPPTLRGPILAFFPTFTLLGQLIGAAVIYSCLQLDDGYRICFAVQWPFSVIPLIMAFIIPESPIYLIHKDKYFRAFDAQKRLDPKGVDTRRSLAILQQNIDHERRQANATYTDCFKSLNLRRTLIVIFANLLPMFFGLALLAKSSYFVQVVGMEADLSLLILVFGIVAGLLANFASIWITSRFGRRPLSMVSLSVLVVLWASMGISGIWSGPATVWYTSGCMIAIIVVAGLGVWPCSYAISAEVSSLHLRSKAQGIGWFTASSSASIFGFVLPYIFNSDQGNLGAKTGFVFAGFCVLALVGVYYQVPEMKGRTQAEIDHFFDLSRPARDFDGRRDGA
ncbi:maltose permease [Fusarium albosuccineum]|uniref:Maltose permease n=1 Tax=Fusarium albosuccineum TaxID=1237068 RepID=A0A8H4L4I7_9HYPO|nr:maltose permease [Fusarium albosuccineum]